MNQPKDIANSLLAGEIIKNLNKRNMEGFYFNSSKEAVAYIMQMIESDSVIAYGGSMTLKETNMLDTLRASDKVHLIDRDFAKDSTEKHQMQLDSFQADYYFMSTNAVTINGELVNIDASGNRVAALIFGPKYVIIMAGMNKIVNDLDSAVKRIQNFATPANTIRLNMDTPCSKVGKCMDCHNKATICCQIVTTRHSFIPGRIKVFLINEELGF